MRQRLPVVISLMRAPPADLAISFHPGVGITRESLDGDPSAFECS